LRDSSQDPMPGQPVRFRGESSLEITSLGEASPVEIDQSL
jgi:hypothetical protein